ncbi:hypothetical protein CH365_08740 [Leptospira neocaledonica]|uniref:Uncharacterized protein n=1 Tax=Leptospira neocaledonica TaxID=2023192 RepID=A0A2N0A061_9LEPT|nr:hypothetical protein CH365_08740 [Leptospira neocaledonica]
MGVGIVPRFPFLELMDLLALPKLLSVSKVDSPVQDKEMQIEQRERYRKKRRVKRPNISFEKPLLWSYSEIVKFRQKDDPILRINKNRR